MTQFMIRMKRKLTDVSSFFGGGEKLLEFYVELQKPTKNIILVELIV